VLPYQDAINMFSGMTECSTPSDKARLVGIVPRRLVEFYLFFTHSFDYPLYSSLRQQVLHTAQHAVQATNCSRSRRSLAHIHLCCHQGQRSLPAISVVCVVSCFFFVFVFCKFGWRLKFFLAANSSRRL